MDEFLLQTTIAAVVGVVGLALVELHHQKRGRGSSILIGLLAIFFWFMAVADITVLGLRLMALAIEAVPEFSEPARAAPRGALEIAALLASFWGSLIIVQVAKNAGRAFAGKPTLPIVWIHRHALRPLPKRKSRWG